ncbi:MAG: thiamine phosphate synthase [Acidobacteria bacterium]|nr:MAG: thiamine phosphate synthase [Acidobacteriota bacterium]
MASAVVRWLLMAPRCLLYYITDRSQFRGDEAARRRALLAKIAEAAQAGVDYIQLREKDLTARELEGLAREAVRVLHEAGQAVTSDQRLTTSLLINSRTDISLAVGAAGVHLPSNDISPAEVRQIWTLCGAGALARRQPVITVACHTTEDVLRAESENADFALFAPVFEKVRTAAAGLAALGEACQVRIPVLALGGVTLENAISCLEAGAAGVAAIRLFQENRIEDVVRTLRNNHAAK